MISITINVTGSEDGTSLSIITDGEGVVTNDGGASTPIPADVATKEWVSEQIRNVRSEIEGQPKVRVVKEKPVDPEPDTVYVVG